MKIVELRNISKEEMEKRIGNGPYIIVDAKGKLSIDEIIQRTQQRISFGEQLNEIYAYGYNKNDGKEYINEEILKQWFEELRQQDTYVFKENNEVYYGGFEEMKNAIDYDMECEVNGLPLKEYFKLEIKYRMEKLDEIRK